MTWVHERAGRVVGLAVLGRLHLFVGQARLGPHEAADEFVALQFAVPVDPHVDGEAGAVLARAEGAEVVAEFFGQHRHDAVGEIGRVAAAIRFLVQLGVRADVMGDVGDGDEEVEAVSVGLREHGVVEVAGIRAVDGDEGDGAQVVAAFEAGHVHAAGGGQHVRREFGLDPGLVQGHEADGPWVVLPPDHLDDADLLALEAARGLDLGRDEVAVGRAVEVLLVEVEIVLRLFVGGDDDEGIFLAADEAHDVGLRRVQLADDLGGVEGVGSALEADEGAVAGFQSAAAGAVGDHVEARRRALNVRIPFGRHGE